MNPAIETRLQVQLLLLRAVAVLVTAFFVWGAVALPSWPWLAAVPLEATALLLLQRGSRARRDSDGETGTGLSAAGAVLVVATIPLTFAIGSAAG